MNRFLATLVVLLTTILPSWSQVLFTTPTTINAGDTTYDNQDITVRGTTVTINGPHTFSALKIESNGIITHSPKGDANFSNGLALTISNNCTIDLGSKIDATGKGWPAGQGPGVGVNSLAEGGGGAAYGGEGTYLGVPSGGVYGDIRTVANLGNFENLGSGGGSGFAGANPGSAGGGAVRLSVGGILTLNGLITSNGSDSPAQGGAGSGGSVFVTVNQLVGGGSIFANGGYGNNRGGGGGGGRIALYYTNKAGFFGSNQAIGNRSNDFGTRAGAGTVFLKQASQVNGDLIIDNAGNGGFSTLLTQEEIFDNVLVKAQGALAPPYGGVLKLTVFQNLVIEATGRISSDGRGHSPSAGPGRGSDSAADGGGGAGFGGEGTIGSTSSGTTYGNLRDPNLLENGTHLGSGGGYGYGGSYPGGAGGGAIRITVNGTLTNDGFITSNGSDSPANGGAGAGGTVYLNVDTLTGSGTIRVNGGFGNNRGGGGSGGRIALYYKSRTGFVKLQAYGNRSGDYGTRAGAGTIFLKQESQPNGDLIIDNNGNSGLPTLLVGPQVFDNVTVVSGGYLAPPKLQLLDLLVTGDLNVSGGATLGARARGYDPVQGPGFGQSSASSRGAGGSYGGRGGSFGSANAGPTYGDPTIPLDFGSGGGFGFNDPIGQVASTGGGAVRLTVNGTLRLDGQINVDAAGYNGNYGGGGSGGSVLLRVGSLTGNGLISAQGDGGRDSIGYGGGGRVALYYVSTASWAGTISVSGGTGATEANGGHGTIYTQQTSGNLIPTLAINPTTLGPGQAAAGSVSLSGPAPAGGLTLNLTNSNTSVVSVPTSVTIEEGATSATFAITASSVTTQQQAIVGVRLWDQLSTKTVTVKPWVASVRFNPSSARNGQAVTGTISLNLAAPAGGLVVALSSNDSTALPVPVSVTIPGGALSATFGSTAGTATTAKQVTVTATVSGTGVSGVIWINPGTAQLSSIAVSPASVLGGSRVFGVVVLTAPAPTGGAIVALSSAVSSGVNPTGVPASVIVPAGKTSASFPITTQTVASPTTVLVTGTLGVSKSATLVVTIPTVIDLQLIPSSVRGTETSIGIVTLSGPSPTPVTVTIISNNGAALPEASFVIPAGQINGTFVIDTTSVSSTTFATITARANGIGKSQQLTITP